MERVWITTVDNPYDPKTQWDEWYAYDTSHGHNTCAYVARATTTSTQFSNADQNEDVELTIDEIIKYHNHDGIELYKKVYI